jgi:hypothetical protein
VNSYPVSLFANRPWHCVHAAHSFSFPARSCLGKGKGGAGKGYAASPVGDDYSYDPDGSTGGFSYANCAVPYLGTGPIPADMWLDQAGCLHMLPPVPLVPGSTWPSPPAGTPAPRPTLAQVPYTSPPWFDALGGEGGGGSATSPQVLPPPTYGAPAYVIEPVLILQQLASGPTSD